MNRGWEKKLAEQAIKFVFKKESKPATDFSLAIVNSDKIRAVNKKYRQQDCPTDVLSFSGLDILICPKVVRENAKKFAIPFEEELSRVAIHGALHFLGYDHERTVREAKEMQDREQRYLEKIQRYI